MARTSSPFRELSYRLGPGTFGLMALVLVASIVSQFTMVLPIMAGLMPAHAIRGEVWRFVTYPWIQLDPLGLLLSLLGLYFVGPSVESRWGTRRFLLRVLLFALIPGVLTTLVTFSLEGYQSHLYMGTGGIITALFVAYIATQPETTMMIFPFPVPMTGTQFLYVSGGILGIYFIFEKLAVLPAVFAFALSLTWFYFDLGRGFRRSWLKFRKRSIETRIARARRGNKLRIVSSKDDDDEPTRYLH